MSKCQTCQKPMTWAEQRKQFARLLTRLPIAEAKPLLPRCQKCMTRLFASLPSSRC